MTSLPTLETVRMQALDDLARESSRELVVSFVGVLLADARTSLTALTDAARQGDLATCKTLAHRCKSSFGSAGADGLCEALEALETDLGSGALDAPHLYSRVAPVVLAFQAVEQQLIAWTRVPSEKALRNSS
ncbi:MAG: Hpt domain-containing protein [Silvanigrellales bacterium]|nr:Hpt domain-containing protein [Silvanigrellales bacterium]